MPKIGLVDCIPRTLFSKASKISAYDEHFVVATISKIKDTFKQLIVLRALVSQKLNNIPKQNALNSKSFKPFAPQTLIFKSR